MPYFKYTILHLLLAAGQLTTPAYHCESGILENGFYVVMEEGRCLDNKVKIANSPGSVCVPDKPTFVTEDITTVGDLIELPGKGTRMLQLTLSEEGAKKLATVSAIYFGKKLVLILNEKVVSVLKIERTITSGEIILQEGLDQSSLAKVRHILLE